MTVNDRRFRRPVGCRIRRTYSAGSRVLKDFSAFTTFVWMLMLDVSRDCAVSALILLPFVNLSLEMDSATSISYMTWRWKVSPFYAAFVYFGDVSLRMRRFDHITTFSLKSIQRTRFPMKTRSFRAHDTIFGDFCDDNVCACAVSILILLPVVNISPEMDPVTTDFLQDANISLVNQRLRAF